MAVSRWTPETRELLTELWGKEMSAADIAAQMGADFNRNMIIGQAHRMKLPAASRGRGVAKRHGIKRSHSKKAKPPQLVAPIPTITRAMVPIIVEGTDFAPLMVRFLNAKAGQCRAIVGHDGQLAVFCGHETVEPTSWCGYHHGEYVAPPKERR